MRPATTTAAGVLGLAAALLAGAPVVAPSARAAETYAIPGSERYFRVEWDVHAAGRRGPSIRAYVYNDSGTHAGSIRVAVDALDAGGQVTRTTVHQVLGIAPPFNRLYVELPASGGADRYRVRVLSWDWVGRGGS
jgi:hypothetical protein